MVANYNNTLHLIVTLPESVMKTQTRSSRASNIFSTPLHDSGGLEAAGRPRRSKSREDLLMAEIDDLYGYVRDGGVPPITKFQYDSDEESYWEEPAYEPLDQFRARLKAIESGQQVSFPAHYRPADPTQLRGLVGGGIGGGGGGGGPSGPPPPPAVMVSGVAVGVGEQGVVVTSEGVGGVTSNGRVSGELPSADPDLPPPLPPRPSEIASAAAVAVNATAAPSSSAPADSPWKPPVPSKTAIQPSQSRRVSAPPAPPPAVARASVNSNSTGPNGDSSGAKSATSSNRDSSTGDASDPGVPPRRVSRSDSEPSITIPSSAAAARPSAAAHRLQNQGEAKLDWKERLRRFDAMQDKDKEGSSSASSSSGKMKAGIRLARDFKDSDISSRTKASSGSSGGRGARKRMQTLYL